jgi:DinB family protein
VSVPSAADVLKVQLRHAWLDSRRVLEDLTEDEYLWEPASPCWSVRRRGSSVRGWGSGEFVCEDAWPPPDPLPTTTIAWRVIHLAAWTNIYWQFAFGDTRPDLNEFDVPGDFSAGLAWLYGAQDDFIATVAGLSDESAFEPRPAHWGESVPVVRLVTTMLTEHVHHIAEIGVLRDLRRGHALSRLPLSPIPDPSWWTGTQSTGA